MQGLMSTSVIPTFLVLNTPCPNINNSQDITSYYIYAARYSYCFQLAASIYCEGVLVPLLVMLMVYEISNVQDMLYRSGCRSWSVPTA